MLAFLAQATVRTTFEWGRVRAPEDWLLPVAATTLILSYVWWMYRRDTRELRPWASLTLLAALWY